MGLDDRIGRCHRGAVAKLEHFAMLVHGGRTVSVAQIGEAMKLLVLARDNVALAESGIRPHGLRHVRLQ